MKSILQVGASGNLKEAFMSAVLTFMKFVIQFKLLIIRKIGDDAIEFINKVSQF